MTIQNQSLKIGKDLLQDYQQVRQQTERLCEPANIRFLMGSRRLSSGLVDSIFVAFLVSSLGFMGTVEAKQEKAIAVRWKAGHIT